MSNPPTLRLGQHTIILVPSGDLETWSAAEAERRLRDSATQWPAREAILRLSASLFGPDDDLDRAIAYLSDAFERHHLIAVAIPEVTLGLPRVHEGAVDWDDIPSLSDLDTRHDDDDDTPSRPTPETPAHVPAEVPAGPGVIDPWGGPPTAPSAVEPAFDALVFTCDRFGLESAIVRPGFPNLPDGVREAPTGIGELSEILGYLRGHPELQVVVVGHADESGKASYNDALSRDRAECVAAILHGRRDDFISTCDAAADIVDLKHALAWAQRRFGWLCDTGELSDIYGPKTKQALPEFRAGAAALLGCEPGAPLQAPPRSEDWGLVFDVMRFAIAEDLACTAAELDELGTSIGAQTRIVTAAGERWPRQALAHLQLPDTQDRRVEVLLFRPDGTIPSLAQGGHVEEIYAPDATVTLRYLPPGLRTFLTVTMRDRAGDPCPAVGFTWRSEHGAVRRGVTDVMGRARLDDVPAGDFSVSCLDEHDVRAKVWAQRLARAIDAADIGMIHRVLRQPPTLVAAVLDAYDGPIRGCGAGTALAHIRDTVRSTPGERTVELLFARAGLASPIRFCFATEDARR